MLTNKPLFLCYRKLQQMLIILTNTVEFYYIALFVFLTAWYIAAYLCSIYIYIPVFFFYNCFLIFICRFLRVANMASF